MLILVGKQADERQLGIDQRPAGITARIVLLRQRREQVDQSLVGPTIARMALERLAQQPLADPFFLRGQIA